MNISPLRDEESAYKMLKLCKNKHLPWVICVKCPGQHQGGISRGALPKSVRKQNPRQFLQAEFAN